MAKVWSSWIAVLLTARRKPLAASLVAIMIAACTAPIDEAGLADRVAQFRPTWESYQEEAKGYIGARPVAEWKGEPHSAALAEGRAIVTFTISGPWTSRDIAMPIMMRGPDLPPRLADSVVVDGSDVRYIFPLEATALIPWVEVQYPRGTRRLTPTRQ